MVKKIKLSKKIKSNNVKKKMMCKKQKVFFKGCGKKKRHP
jgi:hypothetical protein